MPRRSGRQRTDAFDRTESRKGADIMTDKDLRRLSHPELLDILYEQRKRYEDSLAENQALRQQLEDRTLRIASTGSIAEAAIQVNGVFEAAQAAADQYLASRQGCDSRDGAEDGRGAAAARRRSYRMQSSRPGRSYRTHRHRQTGSWLRPVHRLMRAGQNSRKTPTRSSMRTTNCGASSRTAMRTFDFSRFGGRITANDTKRSVL